MIPGKTSPRLLEDLRLYNPQRLPNSQFNILTSLPQPYNGKTEPRKTAKTACVHDWKLKSNQSSNTGFSGKPNGETRDAAAFCAQCRCHVKLRLSFDAAGWTTRPCPQQDAPLHHFKYILAESAGFSLTSADDTERWEAHEKFRCTLENCEAELDVYMISPRLTSEYVNLLTNHALIEERAKAAIASDPARFEGIAVPLPVQVLGNLRSYINNSILTTDGSQKINSQNKRFLLCLGDACEGLLKYLTFEREGDYWIPPRPAPAQPTPLENPVNVLLDDVLKELTLVMSVQEEQERRVLRGDYPLASATSDFYRLLGCLDYETNPATRRVNLTEDDEHPFYPGLGAVINFHDKLLIYAYDQQLLIDPANSPYYLQCLQGIAKGRGSEELHTKAAIEESSGRVSVDDIKSAYLALGLDPSIPMDEETIIGTFKSRVTDAPRQEEELRRCLRIVGGDMNSRRIEDFAADTVHTYEQALNWLGATPEMGDDFITSMYSLKVSSYVFCCADLAGFLIIFCLINFPLNCSEGVCSY
jgi:ubiquitin carboxyl-terminal hydrolase 25